MKKLARILFLIIGCVFPILVGALHTMTHFKDLMTEEVQESLSGTLMILGKEQSFWNTWGVMSFMMGVAFIVIGLLNAVIFSQMKKEVYPPIAGLLAMVFYLSAVIYVGHQFGQAPQFYGGIFGMTLAIVCLVLTLMKR